MKKAETVTFGGSGLDRLAARRGKLTTVERENASYIIFWRGKPLFDASGLLKVSKEHSILKDASGDFVLLGDDNDNLIFAADISQWDPDTDLAEMESFADQSEQLHPSIGDAGYFGELRLHMARLTPRDAELAATAKAIFSWHLSHQFCAYCGEKSDFAMDGWQRDCPSCGRHHFPRTDPVVIMLITHGNSVLLGRSHGWPDGMYSLLAGFVEPGETLEAAVRREVLEEANVQVGDVRYLASQPWPFPTSLMFGCAGQATTKEIVVDPEELDDARWFTREEIVDVFAGQHPTVLPARKGAIAHFLLENWLSDTLD